MDEQVGASRQGLVKAIAQREELTGQAQALQSRLAAARARDTTRSSLRSRLKTAISLSQARMALLKNPQSNHSTPSVDSGPNVPQVEKLANADVSIILFWKID